MCNKLINVRSIIIIIIIIISVIVGVSECCDEKVSKSTDIGT